MIVVVVIVAIVIVTVRSGISGHPSGIRDGSPWPRHHHLDHHLSAPPPPPDYENSMTKQSEFDAEQVERQKRVDEFGLP